MARLHALPYATMCIDCQRELERSGESASFHRGFGEQEAGEETVSGELEN
jgi:RNA polymerase-binding transcription factor DksA